MFCERCGKRYGNGEAPRSTSLPLSKRLLKAVGVSASAPPAPADEPLLRFCLACRGYSCPECWNEAAGFCQTCVPAEMPAAEQPVINLPALDLPAQPSPTPMMSFAPTDDLPPYLAMLADQDAAPQVDPLGDFVVEATAVAELDTDAPALADAEHATPAEAGSVFEVVPLLDADAEPFHEKAAEDSAEVASDEAFAAAEDVVMVEDVVELVADAAVDEVAQDAQLEPVEEVAELAETEEVEPAAAVAEVPEDAEVVGAHDAPESVAAVEALAMDERPIELVFDDEETVSEPEPEASWEWDFVSPTDAGPVDVAQPSAMPLAAAADDAATAEPGPLVDAPVVPAQPQVLPPPVYRPMPPLGPIMPPPPPAATSVTPTIDFDVLQPPPAFVIAPPQSQPLMRPQLPAGMFDGPGPQIRPCHNCDLPVSAKARFCRRCGSAQAS